MIINLSNIGSGGGGSYVLPTATASRLGGVKIGSGITVQNDGTISVSGGSSESNYLIVDALSAVTNPYEGLKVYDKSARTEYFYDGTKFDIISELTFNLDAMTQQERADLNAYLFSLPDTVRKETSVYRDNNLCRYQRDEGSGTGRKIWYQEVYTEESENPILQLKRFALKPDGSYENSIDGKYAAMTLFEADYSARTISRVNASFYSSINYAKGGDGRIAVNIRMKIEDSHYIYSRNAWIESISQFRGKIGGEWLYNGNVIKATWDIGENTATLASWTEMPEITAIGNGLTVSGGTLSVSGGSSAEQDYLIVPTLSSVTETKDGVLAYLSGYSYTAETECIKITPTSALGNPEAYLANIKRVSDGDNMADIYISGNNFYWDWTNDGKWNERNIYDHIIRYKTHNDENWENCYFLLNKADLTAAGYNVVKSGDRQETEVVIEDYIEYTACYSPHSFNIYESGWTKATVPQVYVIDKMTQAERVNLYNFIETNYFNAGNYDLSNFLFYFTIKNNGTVAVPFNIINHYTGTIVFSYAGSKYDETNKVEIRRGFLYSDGTYSLDNTVTFGGFSPIRLSILRDREWFKCDRGTYSAYTFDCTNVSVETTAVDYELQDWNWLFKIYVNSEGNLVDGDWNGYEDDNNWHYKDREGRCICYYKRTGSTIDVVFTYNAPAVADFDVLDTNLQYTAGTQTVDIYMTNNGIEDIYTGNTASGAWSFEYENNKNFCKGENNPENSNPVFAFRCASGTTAMRYFANPVVYFEDIEPIQLYDKDGEQKTFDKKFYFDYGQYLISLISGPDTDYRYAQLTVVAK